MWWQNCGSTNCAYNIYIYTCMYILSLCLYIYICMYVHVYENVDRFYIHVYTRAQTPPNAHCVKNNSVCVHTEDGLRAECSVSDRMLANAKCQTYPNISEHALPETRTDYPFGSGQTCKPHALGPELIVKTGLAKVCACVLELGTDRLFCFYISVELHKLRHKKAPTPKSKAAKHYAQSCGKGYHN